MNISWNLINSNMDKIIAEYEKLYEERDYSECEKILKDIFNIFSAKRGIELDPNENFDHVFHQLYSQIQSIMNTSQAIRGSEVIDYKNLKSFFSTISDDIFKTAEVREKLKQIDPTDNEYRNALNKGIKEAEGRKDEIRKRISFYTDIQNDLYETGEPNLKGIAERDIFSLEYLDEIRNKLNEIQPYQDALDNPSGLSSEDINANREKINELYDEIKEYITQLEIAEQVDKVRLNKIYSLDIPDALNEVNSIIEDLNIKTTSDFTKLYNNLYRVSTNNPNLSVFKNIDFSLINPSSEDGRKAMLDALKPLEKVLHGFYDDLHLYDREIEAYNNQLSILDKENTILQAKKPSIDDIKSSMPDNIKAMIDDDIAYYTDMVNAQMYGNEEYKIKYDKYLALLKKHIKSKQFVTKNYDGSEKTEKNADGRILPKIGEYLTVDYESMQTELDSLRANSDTDFSYDVSVEAILKFLQLEQYKEKLERVTKIKAGDEFALTEYKAFSTYRNAKTDEEKNQARAMIKEEMLKDGRYVSTYHNSTNNYLFHKMHHKTAGKYADTYLPMVKLKEQKTLSDKIKGAGHNVYAFSRWQNPLNVHGIGKKVLIMGSNVLNLATIPVRLPLKALGVAVAKIRYDKTEENPNPYDGRNDARRGARVEYYAENGNNRFVARVKGWIDEIPLIGKSRKKATEKAIVDRQIDEIKKNINYNYENAAITSTIENIEEQQANIRRNREARREDARIIASTKETQGDIFRDPSDADLNILTQRTLARLALEYEGNDSRYVSNTGSRNPAHNKPRNKQFEDPKSLRKISKPQVVNPDQIKTIYTKPKNAEVISADPIGRAIRSKEIKNTLTRLYTIPYLLVSMGERELVKYAVSKLKDTVEITGTRQEQVGTREVKVRDGGHYEPYTYNKKSIVEGNTAGNIKFGDLEYGDVATFEHTGKIGPSVSWIENPTSENIQAMALDFKIPANLDSKTYEALSKLGYKVGDRINYSVADKATKILCDARGRTYATTYIDGLFSLDDGVKITDAIEQYFPKEVSKVLDTILESEAYSGKAGVDFLTDSFSTSHGITSLMEKMKAWGTGWAEESVTKEALESAKVLKEVLETKNGTRWVTDYITENVPITQYVPYTETITDAGKVAFKKWLNGVNNGIIRNRAFT